MPLSLNWLRRSPATTVPHPSVPQQNSLVPRVPVCMHLSHTLLAAVPPPPNHAQLHNDGNYIISLSQLVQWLGEKAEEAEIDILPGFAASEVLYDEDGGVRGVATRCSRRCAARACRRYFSSTPCMHAE